MSTPPSTRPPRAPGPSPRLHPPDGAPRPPSPPTPPPRRDEIDAWLDSVITLLRLPAPTQAEIRDELESHLRERVRDLCLRGEPEGRALARAIDELDGAAALAARFTDAHRGTRRRNAMTFASLGIASTALGIASAVLFMQPSAPAPGPIPGPVAETPAPAAAALPGAASARSAFRGVVAPPVIDEFSVPGLEDLRLTLDAAEAPMGAVLNQLAGSLGRPAAVRWDTLRMIDPKATITLDVRDAPLALILRRLAEQSDDVRVARLTARVIDGVVLFAPIDYFDRLDRELIAYDIRHLQNRLNDSRVVEVITGLVEPTSWPAGGGEVATIHPLGGRLFVTAPGRFHDRIAWILEQLTEGEASAAARTPAAASRAPAAPAAAAAAAAPVASRPAPEAAASATPAPPVPQLFYISGTVPRPGAYALPNAAPPLTVARALDAAGGLPAEATKVQIVRSDALGQPVVHDLPADDLRSGRGPDAGLRPGDRVIVR